MELTVENTLEIAKYVFAKRRTWIGLFSCFGLVLLIAVYLPPINQVDIRIRCIAYFLAIILIFIYWLFLSGRLLWPQKSKDVIIIALSLKSSNPKAQSIVNNTIMRMKDQLKGLGVIDKFKIIEIGTDIFNDNKKAEKYVKNKKIGMVVHGTVYAGYEDSTYRYDLKNFNFSYLIYFEEGTSAFDLVKKDVQLMLLNRDWIIEENNDLKDIKKVTNNLVEILLSIVSIGICCHPKHVDLAIVLLERLLPVLESKIRQEKQTIEISEKAATIKMPLEVLRSGRLRAILFGSYLGIAGRDIENKQYSNAINILNKALKAGVDKYSCYSSLAIASYFEKGVDEAIKYTEKMNVIKKNTFLYFINCAFFSIKKRNYSESVKNYDLARNKYKPNQRNLVEKILKFLNERLTENPHEPAYIYASGILIFGFIRDKDRGRFLLEKFWNIAKDDDNYFDMINVVEKIVKKKYNELIQRMLTHR
jgi:tetratricopeptide (TPR) repeat protein